MIFFKWILIILISSDFLFDFISKVQKRHQISQIIGALVGIGLRAYIVYILATVWNV